MRADGYYWVIRSDNPAEVARWFAEFQQWQLIGIAGAYTDDAADVRVIAGPIDEPRTLQ